MNLIIRNFVKNTSYLFVVFVGANLLSPTVFADGEFQVGKKLQVIKTFKLEDFQSQFKNGKMKNIFSGVPWGSHCEIVPNDEYPDAVFTAGTILTIVPKEKIEEEPFLSKKMIAKLQDFRFSADFVINNVKKSLIFTVQCDTDDFNPIHITDKGRLKQFQNYIVPFEEPVTVDEAKFHEAVQKKVIEPSAPAPAVDGVSVSRPNVK